MRAPIDCTEEHLMKTSNITRPRLITNLTRRQIVAAGSAGMAAILLSGRAPIYAQTQTKKLDFANILGAPDVGGIGMELFSKLVTERSKGEIEVRFHGGTLLAKELEIMNAVKAGNVAIGSPAGAAATVFPEMGVLLVPYLVKDYAQAYAIMNGKIGETLDKQFQDKYKVKVLYYYDFGFRHFWTNGSAIAEPKDLRGKKIRVQLAKVFSDTINGLGGNAVPMAWGEVVSAAKQGVIDGGDLPIANIEALKIYEVAKYTSLTYHNYGPTNVVINLEVWNSLTDAQRTLLLDIGREAQNKTRSLIESVDNFESAKKLLEPRGMTVVQGNVEAFRKIAEAKVWPTYRTQFGALFDEIADFKA
jgi:tripartite ATP-independent transporter DctP family solute receptor